MAVIIGAGTLVDIPSLFPSGGITTINFGIDPQMNRLWQLGSYTPYDTYSLKQRTFSLTAYGRKPDGTGGSQLYDVTPSVSCSNPSNPVYISVTPASCGFTITPFARDYWPTSYSYSKENFGWGQENWSFTTEPELDISYGGTILFIRGIAQGQVQTGPGLMDPIDQGVVVDDSASRDSNGNYIDGESGSVQAGFPGIGQYSVQREYIVTHVGASEGKADGYTGQASIQIPMTPVYI